MIWPYFSFDELKCKCCGKMLMDDDFMKKIVQIRMAAGFPFIVTSGYRCPEHNAKVSSTGQTGPHTTGRAIDIAVHHQKAHALICLATTYGITGIGVNQKGNYDQRFLHLDDLTTGPRPNIWSY